MGGRPAVQSPGLPVTLADVLLGASKWMSSGIGWGSPIMGLPVGSGLRHDHAVGVDDDVSVSRMAQPPPTFEDSALW